MTPLERTSKLATTSDVVSLLLPTRAQKSVTSFETTDLASASDHFMAMLTAGNASYAGILFISKGLVWKTSRDVSVHSPTQTP